MMRYRVTSAEMCAPLADVIIQQLDSDKAVISEYRSDQEGLFHVQSTPQTQTFRFIKEGYSEKRLSLAELNQAQPVRLLEARLVGCLDQLWAFPGDKISVYVHAPVHYKAILYRHGAEKKKIKELGEYPTQLQCVPNGFFVEAGLDWDVSFQFQIPQQADPGLYSILLESENQEPFALPLIIATLKNQWGKKSKLLVLASNTTWQSYNLWGGRSRYRNFESTISRDYKREYLPWIKNVILKFTEIIPLSIRLKLKKMIGKNHPDWMFKRLSIRRPFTNCFLEQEQPESLFTNHLAAGEWRVLAWLEKNKILYDFIPGQLLHKNSDLLSHYQAILLNTHCEYWTPEMFQSVKFHHFEKGLWILNVSGNSIYREIEFYDDGSTRCVSLFFSESCEDETEMIGVRFTEEDYGTAACYQVTQPDHWLFQGLDLPSDQKFAQDTLNQWTEKTYERYDPGRPGLASGLQGVGGSGWETDKLSKTAPNDFLCIAKGMNKRGGADMVIREPDGTRGGVFSVSSITFGGSLLIDKICSGLMKNLMNRVLK